MSKTAFQNWCYRFMERYYLTFRTGDHIGQMLPNDALEKFNQFRQDIINKRMFGGFRENLIGNMDETPVFFYMVSKTTIAKKETRTVHIKTQQQKKVRVTVMLTIDGDGTKLPPFIIFKGSKDGSIVDRVSKEPLVKSSKVFITANKNAWSIAEIMKEWLKKIWIP